MKTVIGCICSVVLASTLLAQNKSGSRRSSVAIRDIMYTEIAHAGRVQAAGTNCRQ